MKTKRKPTIKKLPKYENAGVATNPADPNRRVNTNQNDYVSYASMAANAGINTYAVSQSNKTGAQKNEAYAGTANQVGNAVVSKAIPVMGPIIGAKDTLVNTILKSNNATNVNPDTGETNYKKGWGAANEFAQPAHTTQINAISEAVQNPKDAYKGFEAGTAIWNPLFGQGMKAYDNMYGKDKDNYQNSQDLIDKNNKEQQDQQNLQNQQQADMYAYYQKQNQTQTYSKGGKYRPKIHFVEPVQGNQMYGNQVETFSEGGIVHAPELGGYFRKRIK
jgi:hypothetical protein